MYEPLTSQPGGGSLSHHRVDVKETRFESFDESSYISVSEKPEQPPLRGYLPTKFGRRRTITDRGKIWINFKNSPHVPFSSPITQKLTKPAHSLFPPTPDP